MRLKLTDKVLGWHLRSNFYPPIDQRMVPFARKACQKARDGRWDDLVRITDETGHVRAEVSVRQMVEDLRLEDFVGEGVGRAADG